MIEIFIKNMKKPSWIFDTRSIVNIKKAEKAGFNIWQIGNNIKVK